MEILQILSRVLNSDKAIRAKAEEDLNDIILYSPLETIIHLLNVIKSDCDHNLSNLAVIVLSKRIITTNFYANLLQDEKTHIKSQLISLMIASNSLNLSKRIGILIVSLFSIENSGSEFLALISD